MAKAPMMPVWTDALIADTTHLTAEQFGCYVLILLATWRNNGKALPDDDTKMARICRSTVTRFRRKIRPFLIDFFTVSESGWHQKRLEKEWDHLEKLGDTRREIGAVGGGKKIKQNASKRGGTQTYKKKESPSSSVGEVAARASSLSGGATRAHDLEPGKWKPLGDAVGHPTAIPPPPEDYRHALRQQEHMQFLLASGSPGDLALYNDAQMSEDPDAARRMFELVEARIANEEHNV